MLQMLVILEPMKKLLNFDSLTPKIISLGVLKNWNKNKTVL